MRKYVKKKIIIISGTNRKDSYTLKLAKNVVKSIDFTTIDAQLLDLTRLPNEVYLPTVYYNKPLELVFLQNEIDTSDGVIFCVPEYNCSFPGILKYFIDILRYPDTFFDKPVVLITLTSSKLEKSGAFNSMYSLMNFLNADIFYKNLSISDCKKVISDDFEITDLSYRELLDQIIKEFIEYLNVK